MAPDVAQPAAVAPAPGHVLLRGGRLLHPALPDHPHEGHRHLGGAHRPHLRHPPIHHALLTAARGIPGGQAGQLHQGYHAHSGRKIERTRSMSMSY